MEISLGIISDTFWFTPALLVMFTLTVLLAETLLHKSPAHAGGFHVRIPGGSLRSQFDSINTKLLVRLLLTLSLVVFTGIGARALVQANNHPLVDGVMFAGSGIAMGFTLWTWKLLTPWRDAQIRVASEREVGRDLNLLMLDGCRVFHGLVDDRVGDIDHIIVAPHAVFMVETFAYSVSASSAEENGSNVTFNGEELRFPKRKTSKPVRSTAAKARWLSKHLERKTGITLPVRPVLALPGWDVQQNGFGEVHAVNPKDISRIVVDKAAQPLYEAQRQKIINFLDSQCEYAPF